MAGVGNWQKAASALGQQRVGLVRKLGHNIDLGQREGTGGSLFMAAGSCQEAALLLVQIARQWRRNTACSETSWSWS